MPFVADSAVVHPRAEIAEDVEIGPFTVVGENVKIGAGSKISSHVVLEGWTRIGRNCRINVGAVLGSDPQDMKFRGDESYVIIGDNTTIREYATINRGTFEGESTIVGNNCMVMSYCHIAHNCVLEDRVIMSSFAGLAGHITIEQNAIIGGLVGIHQFVRIGQNAIVGGGSAVRQDILPFTVAGGNPCKTKGLNIVGLRRHNFSPERISQMKRAYKIVFRSKLSEKESLERLNEEMKDVIEVRHMAEFIEKSKRGLARG
ncbi:MAG: acyl-ACP--UDP-N-acetylglucosamine O-acyltransferase [Candidatus Omnitrophota bacterium]|jgi:UDP-N-acetylglucosamine acyltransferase|nr:MAG: acyl-ACP--UDP-N-acetylglucosamine O-acyltransferase [Candidatus Omnitrophota bacterium]